MTSLLQEGLDPAAVAGIVDRALAEDLGPGQPGVNGSADVTSAATIPRRKRGIADVRTRSAGVLAGVEVAALVLERAGAEVTRVREDGDSARAG